MLLLVADFAGKSAGFRQFYGKRSGKGHATDGGGNDKNLGVQSQFQGNQSV